MMFSVAMKGSLLHDPCRDDLRVDDQVGGDVEHDVEDAVGGEEAFGDSDPLVGRVVQRPLKTTG